MERTPESFAGAISSGDADRVNDVIDEIESTDSVDRVSIYSDLFEACYPVYDSDDGYVRQSVVRFLRDAYPMLEIRIATSDTEQVGGYTIGDLGADRERLVEFLLEALEDDDGRVRRAAVDGFETLSVTFNVAELDAEKRALLATLDDLIEELPEQKAEHAKSAKQSVTQLGLVGSLLTDLDIDSS